MLLCSDGLTEMSDEAIKHILRRPAYACQRNRQ